MWTLQKTHVSSSIYTPHTHVELPLDHPLGLGFFISGVLYNLSGLAEEKRMVTDPGSRHKSLQV